MDNGEEGELGLVTMEPWCFGCGIYYAHVCPTPPTSHAGPFAFGAQEKVSADTYAAPYGNTMRN
jgi:hypothetical protein